MDYEGFLPDGTKFDSSRDRGERYTFTLGKGDVIRCWDYLIMDMTKGQRAKLHCPANWAYGKEGYGTEIPPDTDLDFDVEVYDFEIDYDF